MPFGVTAAIAGGLVSAGIGATTAGILAAGIVGAGAGAIIGGGTAALTGGNIGKGALYGGLGGAVTGGVGGALGGSSGAAASAVGDNAATGLAGGVGDAATAGEVGGVGVAGSTLPTDAAINGIGTGFDTAAANTISGVGSAGSASANLIPGATNALSGAGGASPSILSQIGSYVMKNPLEAAKLGATGLAAIQSMNQGAPVDVNKNKANVLNGTGFSGKLPQYNLINSGTPYTGDWYKYGMTPQTPMYSGTLQPVAMKHGGEVRHYAAGGNVMPAEATPLAAGVPPVPPGGANPLATHNGFALGKAIGAHLKASGLANKIQSGQQAMSVGSAIGQHITKSVAPRVQGPVYGQGGGQDDMVPAKLSDGEFVIPADVVADLGDGSSKAGGKVLQKMVSNVRQHKSVKGFPPKAKNPLSYLPKGA